MDSEEEDLVAGIDTSWIRTQERLQNMNAGYFREPMEEIEVKYIYINRNQYIENVVCEKQALIVDVSGSVSRISEDMMIKMIQNRITYVVDLEPEEIHAYAITPDIVSASNRFRRPMRIVGELCIPTSIFIFHNVNTIYFIFHEVEIEMNRQTVKPILKTSSEEKNREPDKRSTKKVRIYDQNARLEKRRKTKQTRKHRIT
jgi:hypothetical protein